MSDINYDKKSRAAHLRRMCKEALGETLTALGINRPAAVAKEIIEQSTVVFDQAATINEHLRTPRVRPEAARSNIDFEKLYHQAFEALVQTQIVHQSDEYNVPVGDEYRARAKNLAKLVIDNQVVPATETPGG